MANKKTLALTDENYKLIIQTIQNGFTYGEGKIFKPNERLATILTLEANLGLRISDILQLHLNDIIRDGNRHRLDIVEQKTGKVRTFTVPNEILMYIQEYALKNNLRRDAKLFDLSERAVQKQLKIVTDFLGLEGIGTHSFRKYFATTIYRENDYNIELVRTLLQHSSSSITQRYIGIQQKEIEEALHKHIKLI
jgi:integrase